MPIWRNAMDWLGLGPDDAYDDYDAAQEPERSPRSPRSQREEPAPRKQTGYQDYEPDGTVRTMPARPSYPTRDADLTGRRPVPATDDSNVQPRPINTQRQAPVQLGRPLHRSPAPLRLRPRGRRQVQRRPAGDHEPRGQRPRSVATTHRFRQRPVLRTERHDGEGRHRCVPAEADPTAQGRARQRRVRQLSVHPGALAMRNI